MIYSIWIIFSLILLGIILKMKRAADEYRKAEEESLKAQEKALFAELHKLDEVSLRGHNQGQSETSQGQALDVSKILGNQGQKKSSTAWN